MALAHTFFIISIGPVDMNKYERFDEIPSRTLKDIKETKRYGRTDGWMDGLMDNVKTVYPPTNTVCGGYNNKIGILIFIPKHMISRKVIIPAITPPCRACGYIDCSIKVKRKIQSFVTHIYYGSIAIGTSRGKQTMIVPLTVRLPISLIEIFRSEGFVTVSAHKMLYMPDLAQGCDHLQENWLTFHLLNESS